MMEAGETARRVARQLGSSDCVVRRCWEHHILTLIATSLGVILPSRTIRSSLDEVYLGSRCLLRVLLLAPTHRRLRFEWYHERENWIAAERNRVVFSDESRFNLSSDDNRVRVWRPPGEHINPAFALQRHTAPKADVMVCGAIAYNTQFLLILIRSTMTAKRYALDILQPPMLPLMQRLPKPFFNETMLGITRQRCHQTFFTLLLIFLGLPDLQICLQLRISGIIWDGHLTSLNELEARMERNV
ncbi:transposable element Tcb1 transposase [Trichonephila clavipes]|nr:transposable element Tcb1 transposase [Trichonephila clavipes]